MLAKQILYLGPYSKQGTADDPLPTRMPLCRQPPACYHLPSNFPSLLHTFRMLDPHRCHRWTLLLACLVLVTSGCAALRKPKIVPESITTSRQLSRDGVAAMDMGDTDLARTLLQKAVETSPSDIDARRHLAEVLWQQGNQRDAVVHLEAAVRLDPKHAPTVVRSGEMLLEIGATDSAAERAEQAIALDDRFGSSVGAERSGLP